MVLSCFACFACFGSDRCVTIVQASTANDYPVARFHFINENVIHIRIEPPGNQKHDFQIRFEDRDSETGPRLAVPISDSERLSTTTDPGTHHTTRINHQN